MTLNLDTKQFKSLKLSDDIIPGQQINIYLSSFNDELSGKYVKTSSDIDQKISSDIYVNGNLSVGLGKNCYIDNINHLYFTNDDNTISSLNQIVDKKINDAIIGMIQKDF